MITLPFEAGRDMTKEARIQPNAGISAPVTERTAQLASRHVVRITRQQRIAASGTGPAVWLYWKLPIRPSTAPSRTSAP
jgi:hypothetical protein